MLEQIPILHLHDSAVRSVSHIGKDVNMVEGFDFNMTFPREFRVADYMVMFITEGTLKGKTNGQPTSFSAPAVIIMLPDEIYSFRDASPDLKGCLITYSKSFSEQLNIIHQFQLNVALREQASLQLDGSAREVMLDYYSQLKRIASFNNNPFQRDAALHMTRAFFYGMGCYYYNAKRKSLNTRQKEIAEEFLSLIDENGAYERKMEFYEEKMHLSAKYIASVVHKETGRMVSEWIEQAVMREAKRLLTETSMTVQQIAHLLRFKDQAYFGAYFKRYTGMSPKQYRMNN